MCHLEVDFASGMDHMPGVGLMIADPQYAGNGAYVSIAVTSGPMLERPRKLLSGSPWSPCDGKALGCSHVAVRLDDSGPPCRARHSVETGHTTDLIPVGFLARAEPHIRAAFDRL